jgi:hypothetical protein
MPKILLLCQIRKLKPLRFNKSDKNGNAVALAVKSFEANDSHSSMFHMGNIIQMAKS